MESFGTLKQISSPDKGFSDIAGLIIKYRSTFCEELKKRIKKLIEYLCKYSGEKEVDLCDDEIYKIISALCKLYEYYRKYCCFVCCTPKIPEWDLIVMNLNTINQYLSPKAITQEFGLLPSDPDFGKPIIEIPEIQLQVCESLKDTLNELIYIICKYRDQNLCGDNELTRSITKLCKIYPYFRGNCCNKAQK